MTTSQELIDAQYALLKSLMAAAQAAAQTNTLSFTDHQNLTGILRRTERKLGKVAVQKVQERA